MNQPYPLQPQEPGTGGYQRLVVSLFMWAETLVFNIFYYHTKCLCNSFCPLLQINNGCFSAFRPGYNTQYVLMNIVEKWKGALDSSKSSGTLLMDLTKALDIVLSGCL